MPKRRSSLLSSKNPIIPTLLEIASRRSPRTSIRHASSFSSSPLSVLLSSSFHRSLPFRHGLSISDNHIYATRVTLKFRTRPRPRVSSRPAKADDFPRMYAPEKNEPGEMQLINSRLGATIPLVRKPRDKRTRSHALSRGVIAEYAHLVISPPREKQQERTVSTVSPRSGRSGSIIYVLTFYPVIVPIGGNVQRI